MLLKKRLCGNEKREKKWKEELIKSQQGAPEKFVFKKVDIQQVYINSIILNETIFVFGLKPIKCEEHLFILFE
jgi:hypothetical protein